MPIIGGLIAGVGAPVIGGLIGADQASKKQAAANDARNQALAQFANVKAPSIQDMMLALQNYQVTGQMNPEMEQAINLNGTALSDISRDPRLAASQMQALQQVAGVASGNPNAADTAGFELARQNSAGEMQAKNAQVLQEMQQRGQAGSGAELLAKLKNNQSGTQMLQNAELQQAQAMQQAKMAALQQQANMAGNMRQQDYGEQQNLATAKDAIAKFNAQNSQNIANTNVTNKNAAQSANLTNQQNTANMNTDLKNKQNIANTGLNQQNFGNQMQLAGAKAGQYGNQAAAADTRAGQTAGMWSGIGQGVGTAANAYLQNSAKSPTGTAVDTTIPQLQKPNGYLG